VSDQGFQHILRVLNTNVDGRQKARQAPSRHAIASPPSQRAAAVSAAAARSTGSCLLTRACVSWARPVQVMFAITAIKGIGRRLANVACKKAEVDLAKRAGELSASELESLMVVVSNPRQFRVPDWFLNRCGRRDGEGNTSPGLWTNPRLAGFSPSPRLLPRLPHPRTYRLDRTPAAQQPVTTQ